LHQWSSAGRAAFNVGFAALERREGEAIADLSISPSNVRMTRESRNFAALDTRFRLAMRNEKRTD